MNYEKSPFCYQGQEYFWGAQDARKRPYFSFRSVADSTGIETRNNILSFTTLNDPISRFQEKHLLRCIGERKLPKRQHEQFGLKTKRSAS